MRIGAIGTFSKLTHIIKPPNCGVTCGHDKVVSCTSVQRNCVVEFTSVQKMNKGWLPRL